MHFHLERSQVKRYSSLNCTKAQMYKNTIQNENMNT